MQDVPKWKRFELLVKEIQEKLTPDSIVLHNQMVMGKTGTSRQVDISIKTKVGQFEIFIALECKDLNKPVDVKSVEEFCGLLEDIQATKGGIVSYHGFTSSAKKKAELKGIDLYRLIDTSSSNWPVKLEVPIICTTKTLSHYQFQFSSKYDTPIYQPEGDQRHIPIYDQEHNLLGRTESYFLDKWNKHEISSENGWQNLSICKVFMQHRDIFFPIDITYDYEVKERYYLGKASISELQGFLDEKENKVITSELIVRGYLDIEDIQSSWKPIQKEGIEKVNYLFSVTWYEGLYPRSENP